MSFFMAQFSRKVSSLETELRTKIITNERTRAQTDTVGRARRAVLPPSELTYFTCKETGVLI